LTLPAARIYDDCMLKYCVLLILASLAAAQTSAIVVEPGAKLVRSSPVVFPAGVTTVGAVIVETTINAKGEVTDARVIRGPEDLRRAALSSVLDWQFDTGLPRTVQSTIRFVNAPAPVADASCLSGVWAQDQVSHWRWRFEAQDGGLSISRTDGFVSGTFRRTGTVWTGELHWGSGEIFNNVVLSPSENCREVRTNQIWWFKR
jgi:hypothetical protein